MINYRKNVFGGRVLFKINAIPRRRIANRKHRLGRRVAAVGSGTLAARGCAGYGDSTGRVVRNDGPVNDTVGVIIE